MHSDEFDDGSKGRSIISDIRFGSVSSLLHPVDNKGSKHGGGGGGTEQYSRKADSVTILSSLVSNHHFSLKNGRGPPRGNSTSDRKLHVALDGKDKGCCVYTLSPLTATVKGGQNNRSKDAGWQN